MRIVFVLCVFFGLNGFSQISYDFSNSLPPDGENISAVSKIYFGLYSSEGVDIDYEMNEDGVFAISLIYNSMSRETIRESSKYSVKDGYLFGVTESDSIPCELQGEYYHFAIKFKEKIIGGASKNILTKVNKNTYIVNFEENGHYTPSLLQFKGKELNVQHFTYDEATTIFDAIALRTENPTAEMTYVTLEPTLEEWNAITQEEILAEKIVFIR